MRTVPFGKTGIQVSAFCLGTMHMGSRISPQTSCDILNFYTEAGGAFIDTSNNYTHWNPQGKAGESEALLGEWMYRKKNRSKLFIATKVGMDSPGVEKGLKAHQIREECEKSLKRLKIDTIDLYYAHKDDRNTPLEETAQAFDSLVKVGKVRFIGRSNCMTWRLAESRRISRINGWAEYCCIEQRHTYLRLNPPAFFSIRNEVNFELLDYCRTENLPIIGFSPLIKGALCRSDKPLPKEYVGSDSNARLKALHVVVQETGATINQVVLAWVTQRDQIVIPLFSASTIEQIKENVGAQNLTLSTEQMKLLNEAAV